MGFSARGHPARKVQSTCGFRPCTLTGSSAWGREVHIPPARQLPALRRYTAGGEAAAIRGAPFYLLAMLEWDTMEYLPAAFASPELPQRTRRACNSSPPCAA